MKTMHYLKTRMHEAVKRLIDGDVPMDYREVVTCTSDRYLVTIAYVCIIHDPEGSYIQVFRLDDNDKLLARNHEIYKLKSMTMSSIAASVARYLRREIQRKRHIRFKNH